MFRASFKREPPDPTQEYLGVFQGGTGRFAAETGRKSPRPIWGIGSEWSPEFAYAIGLIATDGCIYGRRYINLTSKDEEQIANFLKCLDIQNKVSKKGSGREKEKKYFLVQFGDIKFVKFLDSIGITPHKSKTMGALSIPDRFFFDFLRGCFDGDGTFYSYWDPRWASSYMFYTVFLSASERHIVWIRETLVRLVGIKGHFTKTGKSPMYEIKYAKAESLQLLPKLYYNRDVVCLSRKRLKIEKALLVEGHILTK
jgi:hypothetical protein